MGMVTTDIPSNKPSPEMAQAAWISPQINWCVSSIGYHHSQIHQLLLRREWSPILSHISATDIALGRSDVICMSDAAFWCVCTHVGEPCLLVYTRYGIGFFFVSSAQVSNRDNLRS